MSAAFLLDGGQLFVTQAAVQSIVVASLLPGPGAAFTRWTDAVVGGMVALVAATVVPAAPLRRPREQASVVMRKIAGLLRAAGVNYPDVLIIQNKYQTKPELPFVPGGEATGIITSVGTGVEGWKVGDRVSAQTTYGGYAEEVLAETERLAAIPDSIEFP